MRYAGVAGMSLHFAVAGSVVASAVAVFRAPCVFTYPNNKTTQVRAKLFRSSSNCCKISLTTKTRLKKLKHSFVNIRKSNGLRMNQSRYKLDLPPKPGCNRHHQDPMCKSTVNLH